MNPDHRRAFLGYCAFAGLTSTSFPGALLAQIRPGTATIEVATIREAARLAGLAWTEAECQDVAESLSSLSASIARIGKDSLANHSPLPFHFDPRPPGTATPRPAGDTRLPAPPRVRRPARLEEAAFWPATHLAALIRSRQATSVEITRM